MKQWSKRISSGDEIGAREEAAESKTRYHPSRQPTGALKRSN
jgi:hypothetical protein